MTSLWFNGCTNLLCLPPILVDHFYFAIMLIANVLNCLVALASIYRVIRRQSFCRPHGENDDKLPSDGTAPAVTVVVACYLPNEQVIIESTIEHILLQLDWPSDLTLHIVYNTPSALPFEETLRRLEGCHYAPRRKLRITKVDASTSKAENLNHILPTITDEFVVLYDADHHPDTNSLVRLASALLRSEYVAMQGSTYIRNKQASLLARAVDAEFFVTHFIYFPAMEILGGTGYFGGSNALWRTHVLQQYPFDRARLTEDVDVSARALLDGHRIGFCPKARSGELAPAGPRALISQRLRWFMGWEQVTHAYYWKVFVSGLSLRAKAGFCYLFHLRWLLLFAAALAAVINPVITSPFVYPLMSWTMEFQVCVMTAVVLYGFVALLALHHSNVYEERRRQPMAMFSILIFFIIGWLYVIIHITLQTIAFVKVALGREGRWEVTARLYSGTSPAVRLGAVAGTLAEPLLPAAQGPSGRARTTVVPETV